MDMRKIGLKAKVSRLDHSKTQKEIAADLGYSSENIAAFEQGRNNNAHILLYYMSKFGFNPMEVQE